MKKKIALILSALLCSTAMFTACKEDESKTLYIEIDNAGYGIAWIDPLIDMFEEEHPGVEVKKTYLTKAPKTILNKIVSGTSNIDISIVETTIMPFAQKKISANGQIYDSPFEDLTEFYQEKVPGENITIEEKMTDSWREYNTVYENGQKKYYCVPWMQSLYSFVVNYDVFDKTKYDLPNTTDEMFALFAQLKKDGITPLMDSLSSSYLQGVIDLWVAQYNGSEAMKLYYQGYDIGASNPLENRYVDTLMLVPGLYESLQTVADIIAPADPQQRADSKTTFISDYKTSEFTEAQNVFMEGTKDKIAFMPNGLWLEREMEANYEPGEVNLEFVKIPVISALGEKLGITDPELSAIIDYVDGKTTVEPTFTSTKGLTKASVIETVRDSRKLITAWHDFGAMITSYSTKKDLAKDFLKLLATDAGIEAMLTSCGGAAPFKYDLENSPVKNQLSPLVYSGNKLIQEGKYFFTETSNLFTLNSLSLCMVDNINAKLGAIEPSDRWTVDKVYNTIATKAKEKWSVWLRTAGIS